MLINLGNGMVRYIKGPFMFEGEFKTVREQVRIYLGLRIDTRFVWNGLGVLS